MEQVTDPDGCFPYCNAIIIFKKALDMPVLAPIMIIVQCSNTRAADCVNHPIFKGDFICIKPLNN